MAIERAGKPYIWVTWLPKLLTGESSCEWAAWFKAHHEGWSWEKTPRRKDVTLMTEWQMNHTSAINRTRQRFEEQSCAVFTENQNAFRLAGQSATLGGKPDLIAAKDSTATIVDVKTGKPSLAHNVQVLLYMYAVPRALKQYQGVAFDGLVVYNDHAVEIPTSAVDPEFIRRVSALIRRIGAGAPARRVPSGQECRFCEITLNDCPDRTEGHQEDGQTSDF